MSKRPDPSRPKDTRPPKDKPAFPSKPKKKCADELDSELDAYADELAAKAPALDPSSAQFQRLRAVLAPAYERMHTRAA